LDEFKEESYYDLQSYQRFGAQNSPLMDNC